MKSAAAYLVGALALLGGCGSGDRSVQALRQELDGGPGGGTFDPRLVADLPEPARRFLLRAIEPGTPLARSVDLEMHGTIRLGADRDPVPMTATQILSPPTGFVWQARTAGGLMRIRGYDRYSQGEGEMRWRGDAGPGNGYVRFDVEMEGEVSSGGYRIPARVQAGWELGGPDEFRFFDATLDRVTFR